MYRVAPRDSSTPEREGEKRRGGAQAAAVAKRKPRPTLYANDGRWSARASPRVPASSFDPVRLGPKIWIILCFFLTGSSIVASPITTAALIQKWTGTPAPRFASDGLRYLRGPLRYGTALAASLVRVGARVSAVRCTCTARAGRLRERVSSSSATRQRLTKCLTKAPSREHHDHRCHIVIGALRKRRLAQRLRRIVCASSLGQRADHKHACALIREDFPHAIGREQRKCALPLRRGDRTRGRRRRARHERRLRALEHSIAQATGHLWGGEGAVLSTCMLGDGGREAGSPGYVPPGA